MPRTIVIRSEDEMEALRERVRDLRPALQVMGEVLATQAHEAFEIQSLSELAWEPRYPNQRSDPFVNVAGVLADLNAGQDPKARRFENRPAGIDSSSLVKSIDVKEVTESSVTVGSEAYHAQMFQKGGQRSQPVTEDAKIRLLYLLEERPELGSRLGTLLDLDELVTRVVPRPFMGITDNNRKDFVEVLEIYLSGSEESDG